MPFQKILFWSLQSHSFWGVSISCHFPDVKSCLLTRPQYSLQNSTHPMSPPLSQLTLKSDKKTSDFWASLIGQGGHGIRGPDVHWSDLSILKLHRWNSSPLTPASFPRGSGVSCLDSWGQCIKKNVKIIVKKTFAQEYWAAGPLPEATYPWSCKIVYWFSNATWQNATGLVS